MESCHAGGSSDASIPPIYRRWCSCRHPAGFGKTTLLTEWLGDDAAPAWLSLDRRDSTLVQLSGDSPNRWFGPLGRIIGGRLLSIVVRQSVTSFTVEPHREDLELLASLIDSGAVRTVLDRTYALNEVPAALEHVETGRTRGKVAVMIAPSSQETEANRHDTPVGRLR